LCEPVAKVEMGYGDDGSIHANQYAQARMRSHGKYAVSAAASLSDAAAAAGAASTAPKSGRLLGDDNLNQMDRLPPLPKICVSSLFACS